MEWNREDVQLAFRLFMNLLKEGLVAEEKRELHYAYQRPAVREIIEEVIEEEAQVTIFELKGTLFLTPGVNNTFLGYKNAQLRDAMNLENNSHLYLAYFIILCLLSSFYNSDDQSMAARQFLTLFDLEKAVTEQLEQILQEEEEVVTEQEKTLGINLSSAAQIWHHLPPFDDRLKKLKMGKNNRISFILRILTFLEDEGLISLLEEDQIFLTEKLEHLIYRYYFHSERKELLLGFFSPEKKTTKTKEEDHAADQPDPSDQHQL